MLRSESRYLLPGDQIKDIHKAFSGSIIEVQDSCGNDGFVTVDIYNGSKEILSHSIGELELPKLVQSLRIKDIHGPRKLPAIIVIDRTRKNVLIIGRNPRTKSVVRKMLIGQ
mgnify:CR=1 FL=1